MEQIFTFSNPSRATDFEEIVITSLSPKDRIIFPLDFESLDQAIPLIRALRDHVGMFKVGLALFVREGISGLRRIEEIGALPIFVDLKFYDIPETVARASSSLMSAGVDIRFMTVHASGGEGVIRAAVEKVDKNTKVLGITVLTSSTGEELRQSGIEQEIQRRVLALAAMTKRAGGAGVVCSGEEAKAVKSEMGHDFVVVTPGIRPQGVRIAGDDQKRRMAPGDAILKGADYLVVGRPIYEAPDPAKAAVMIAREIEAAILKS